MYRIRQGDQPLSFFGGINNLSVTAILAIVYKSLQVIPRTSHAHF
jgi:hypothetical protein